MQTAMDQGVAPKEMKSKEIVRVQLSDRDLEIIRFLLEMKFASVNEIQEKFFENVEYVGEDCSPWVYRRLKTLVDSGFLKAQRLSFDGKQWYQATYKGYQAHSQVFPEYDLVKPSEGIDVRTFDHDRKVLECRLKIESLYPKVDWASERRLKAISTIALGLPREYMPDAIYAPSENFKVAFEMEISVKARVRYTNKVLKFVEIMRSDSEFSHFKKAIFVCVKDSVFKILKEETDLYGDLFQVQKFEEFMNQREVLP